MENDSIRASGKNTLVDIWVNGKLRAISLSKEAVETFLGTSRPVEMSEEERCDFVRAHLSLVVTAVKAKLRDMDPDADSVVIDIAQPGGRTADRRKADRRKSERRKLKTPVESLPNGDRRRTDRRKKERRSPKN
jgi:hypothetical protein